MIDVASLVPSLIGLGTKIGTSIPSLKKPKKMKPSYVPTRAGAQIVGASQAGQGASRGLALRQGLRAAAQGAGEASAAQLQSDRATEAFNQGTLERRNQRVAEFGTDLAKGLGDMAGIAIGPKGGDTPGTAAVGMKANSPEAMAQAMQTLPSDQRPDDPTTQTQLNDGALGISADEINAGIQQQQSLEGDAAAAGEIGGGADMGWDPVAHTIAGQNPNLVDPQVEQELALQLNLRDLALAQAERMGINPVRAGALISKQLGLQPGQSSQNPFGVTLSPYEDEEGY